MQNHIRCWLLDILVSVIFSIQSHLFYLQYSTLSTAYSQTKKYIIRTTHKISLTQRWISFRSPCVKMFFLYPDSFLEVVTECYPILRSAWLSAVRTVLSFTLLYPVCRSALLSAVRTVLSFTQRCAVLRLDFSALSLTVIVFPHDSAVSYSTSNLIQHCPELWKRTENCKHFCKFVQYLLFVSNNGRWDRMMEKSKW